MSSVRNVTWRGLTADYTPDELDIMAQLRTHERELLILHEFKALLDATIVRNS